MFCKKCGANIDDGAEFCAGCGAPVPVVEPEVIEAEVPAPQTEEPEQAAPEKDGSKKQQSLDPEAAKRDRTKLTKLIVTIVCLVLLAAVLVVVVLKSMNSDLFDKTSNEEVPEETQQQTESSTETTAIVQVVDYPSKAVDAATAEASMDEVVATFGDYQLTNGQFQIYYWFQVYMYYENYIDYIQAGYISLDFKQDLSKQTCFEDSTISWEKFFTDKALTLWHSYAAMNTRADQEGFEMSAEVMEKLRADTLEDAKTAGYETADEYITNMMEAEVGPGTNVEEFWKYQEFVNRANAYYADWYEKATPTAAEMEAYYAENEQTFVDGGSGKDAGSLVDVRHILVMVDEDTDAGWTAAADEAERIYQEWKDGGATEELFAELAGEYSEDGGSNTNGGLYSSVQQGYMVEVFDDWIFDETRQTGDSAILKANYHYQGYHIMYFVNRTYIWQEAVKQTMLTERATTMLSESMKAYDIEKLEDQIKIGQPYL